MKKCDIYQRKRLAKRTKEQLTKNIDVDAISFMGLQTFEWYGAQVMLTFPSTMAQCYRQVEFR